jgi:hypothetical protein
MTRNMRGNAKVNVAAAGYLQNAFCSHLAWRTTAATLTAAPLAAVSSR